MGRSERRKGKDAENEIANKLYGQLGIELKRNLEQNRNGGYDLEGLPWFAIEVKRHEDLRINEWWEQAKEQAEHCRCRMPILAWRQSRKPWTFRAPYPFFFCRPTPHDELFFIQPATWEYTADMSLETFCYIIRERWL